MDFFVISLLNGLSYGLLLFMLAYPNLRVC